MDINQAARMIEWLDEERRRDKTTIATMEERVAQQQEIIDTLQKRLNNVESEQTVMQNQFVPTTRETEIIDQIRKEMNQLFENAETKRISAEREAERRADRHGHADRHKGGADKVSLSGSLSKHGQHSQQIGEGDETANQQHHE